jgi:PKD repeat protein
MATCTKCGKLNYEGVKYCTACGTPLTSGGNYDDNQDRYEPEASNNSKSQEITEKQNSSPKKGVNKRIIYIVLGLVLLVGLCFLIWYLMSSSSNEIKVKFEKRPDEVFPGVEVTFEDKTEGAETWQWDFGDEGNEEAHERVVYHTYEYPGEYTVKLIVNGEYSDSLIVTVKEAVVDLVDDDPEVIITGPTEFFQGEQVEFFDNTPGATTWEWKFGETGQIDATSNPAFYTFQNVNRNAQVSVRNNVSKKTGILSVTVKRKKTQTPTGGGTPAPKKLKYSENDFKTMCQNLINSGADPTDSFQAFRDGIAGGDGSIEVRVKEDNKTRKKDLSAFMQSLGFKKGKTIESVKFEKDQENLVIGIDVVLK